MQNDKPPGGYDHLIPDGVQAAVDCPLESARRVTLGGTKTECGVLWGNT